MALLGSLPRYLSTAGNTCAASSSMEMPHSFSLAAFSGLNSMSQLARSTPSPMICLTLVTL
ncbi:Uncharacterised protein [Bordetella pertussis]|nr:Uncharacterised protein [Bordetella pertussis]